MKVKVLSLDGNPVEEIELPQVFETEVRGDLIRRAILSAQSARIQPWGTDEMAGKRTSAETWGKGFGVSRVRRVKGTRYPASGMGAFNPHTVGGRRAHPPKTEKVLKEKINKKERKLAMMSAISATAQRRIISSRGHAIEGISQLPIVVTDELETVDRTEQVRKTLEKIGAWKDITRVQEGKKVRAGRGKMRGRRYRSKIGPLIVISQDRGISKGAGNLPGVDVVGVRRLSTEMLAPGGRPGRLTIWTKGAIEKLSGDVKA
ncbi:MAG: 50S ribosomal protein L4 [Candidatus Hadarchaeales archaeon]